MSELIVRGARKAYGATVALSRGDLHLRPGEVHVLIGSNGSGKSTLCKIVAGSVKPDAGDVLLDESLSPSTALAQRGHSASASSTRNSAWLPAARSPKTSCCRQCR